MKKLALKLMFAFAFAAISFTANAQAFLEDPRYGDTPEERKENVLALNFFNDMCNNQDYDGAVKYLQQLMAKSPKATQNIYINGANIYKNKIARATSVAQKNIYIDSLMLIYDLRAEHFGDHAKRGKGYIMTLKARDYLTYKPADRVGVMKLFKEAIDVNGDDLDADVVNIYFKELTDDYKADNIEAEMYLNEYDKLIKIFDIEPTPEKAEAKKTFEALFISSGAANCENLEIMFKPRIAANPNDNELLEKAVALLTRAKCDSEFQLEIAEKFYKIKPSTNTAMALADAFGARKDHAKALKYLNEAIATETDPIAKANLSVHIAATELAANNARSAAEFAKRAIDINPDNGYAYMILGQAYAVSAKSTCSGFDYQSVFWLVYDTLLKAKSLLASDDPQQKTIESQLGTYRAAFPPKEECFFRGISEGSPITVNCGWISGRTTVREGK